MVKVPENVIKHLTTNHLGDALANADLGQRQFSTAHISEALGNAGGKGSTNSDSKGGSSGSAGQKDSEKK